MLINKSKAPQRYDVINAINNIIFYDIPFFCIFYLTLFFMFSSDFKSHVTNLKISIF